MRYVHGLSCLMMVLFAAVQYNDPDGPLWSLLYGIPAIWAGLAATRPRLLAHPFAATLLGLSLLAALVLTFLYWPPVDQWWRQAVWWESEPAREGMGLMIVTAVLLAVLPASFSSRARRIRSGRARLES